LQQLGLVVGKHAFQQFPNFVCKKNKIWISHTHTHARTHAHTHAKNRDQLRNPTLGNRVWAIFTFCTICCNAPTPSNPCDLDPEYLVTSLTCGQHQDVNRAPRGRVSQNDIGQRLMEKVGPWSGQPSDRGQLKHFPLNVPRQTAMLPKAWRLLLHVSCH